MFETAERGLVALRTGADSVLSPAQRLAGIRGEISALQVQAGTAEGQDLVDIQQRLAELFPEAVRIARTGFGEGSSVAFAEFRRAEQGLDRVTTGYA